ncbi:MAG: TonB-dependent receptor [Acidobacteria bacterium]|nr:TonB-dependent receptor [Acidobacteriota bacterium]
MTWFRWAIVFAFVISLAYPQSSGTIQGVVTDNSGAVIPGASVRVVNPDTGVEVNATTNQVGFYTVPALNPGRYSLTCSAAGFAPKEYPSLRLEVQQTARVDCTLNIGRVVETVEVSAAAQLLQSEKTEVGQVIDGKRIVEMPLNGRNYLQLARFAVGVLPSRQFGKGTRQDGEQGGEGGFLAVGMHAAQNNILLDGSDNSSRNSGGALGFQAQAVKPSVDAVGEFKVVTNNTSAEYGYRMGAKVVVSTKSGTNDLHGSLFEFVRNDKFDASNFFANRSGASKPSYRHNQFGGTLGGPMIKNKMFYFGSYQGTRIRLGRSFVSTVPSQAVRDGNFSNQPNPTREIFDPLTYDSASRRRMPFPNFTIPRSRFDPVAAAVIPVYPLPNIPGRENLPNNFFFSPSNTNDFDQYDARWDYNISDDHRTFVRYSHRNEFKFENGPMPPPAVGGTGQTVDLPGHNLSWSLNSTFGPTMFNEVRVGWTFFPTVFDIPIKENLQSKFGIKGAPGDMLKDGRDNGFALFVPGDGFNQLGPRAFWPNFNDLTNWQIGDNFAFVTGRHTVKVGGEWRRSRVPRDPSRFRRGRFNFSGDYTAEFPFNAASRGRTGNGMADMILGWAQNETWGFPNGETTLAPYLASFIQDDWKITPRLTLNLGARYEIFFPALFPDPDKQSVSRFLTEINGRPLDPREFLRPNQGGFGEADYLPLFVSPADGRDCGCTVDKNNIAPRLGIAYRLTNRTVVRTGAGVYYGEHDNVQSEAGRFFTGAPLANEFNAPQDRDFTRLFLKDGFAPVKKEGFPRAGLSVATSRDFLPQPYAYQWFFDLQQELPGDTLLTLGYQGTGARQLFYTINVNQPLTPDPVIANNQRFRRPFFNSVDESNAGLNTSYNALTIKAEKRFSKGLTFLSSFTWSHNLDYGDENLQQGNGSTLFTYNRKFDRGNASLDRRLAYVASFIYALPFGRGRPYLTAGPASWILGGWEVGGIVSLLAGTPDAHTINQNTTNVGGANRGDLVRNPNLPRGERTIDRWFDTTAVVPGRPGEFDNAGRNLIVGPPTYNLDFSLDKNFYLPWENHYVQFRFESFNFTNTPAFGRPNRTFGTAAVGTINSADEPRRIQFGLKYVF